MENYLYTKTDGSTVYKLIKETNNYITGVTGFVAIGSRNNYHLISAIGMYGKTVDIIGINAGDYFVYMKDWQNPITSAVQVTLELTWEHI